MKFWLNALICGVFLCTILKIGVPGDANLRAQDLRFVNELMQPQSVMQLAGMAWQPEETFGNIDVAVAPQPEESLSLAWLPEENPGNDEGGNEDENIGEGEYADQETLGTPPEDTRLLFLRQVTVLLSPGQWQYDYGIDYTWYETTFPTIIGGNVLATERVRLRKLVVPFAVRYGLTKRMQLFANIPMGWGSFERANPEAEEHEDVFGLGDVSAGFNYLIRNGQGTWPDIIGTLGFSAPTGEDPFGPTANTASLGSGFWTVHADLMFVKSYDPIVVFYGAGYRHYFARDYLNSKMALGEQIQYNFGIGFAINDSITLSTAFLGSYETETQIDDVGVPDSTRELLSVRLALTAITSRSRIIEPFVWLGLTSDAPNARIGVIVTR